MEGSFADAANNHGFKRARWRRLWRQRTQDYTIAAVQNVRILLKHGTKPSAIAMAIPAVQMPLSAFTLAFRAILLAVAAVRGDSSPSSRNDVQRFSCLGIVSV